MKLSDEEKAKRDLDYAEYVKTAHELYTKQQQKIKLLSTTYWKRNLKARLL